MAAADELLSVRSSVRSSRTVSAVGAAVHPLMRRDLAPLSHWMDKVKSGEAGGRPLKSEQDAELVTLSDLSADKFSARTRKSKPGAWQLPAIDTGLKLTPKRPVTSEGTTGASQEFVRMSARSLPEVGRFGDKSVPHLVSLLRDKLKSSFIETRRRFYDNDPDRKGNISRAALQRLVAIWSGQSVQIQLLNKLLEQLGMADKQSISFEEFSSKLCERTGESNWLSRHSNRGGSENRRPSTKDSLRSLSLPIARKERSSLDEPPALEPSSPSGRLSPIKEHEKPAEESEEVADPDALPVVLIEEPPAHDRMETDNSAAETAAHDHDCQPLRSAEEVENQVRLLFANRYVELERAFRELDEYNANWLTVDSMVTLFEQLKLEPAITRAEIHTHLWPRFYLRNRAKLDFWEFCRYFMYTKDTSSFPNSKRHPPRRGDSDFLLRSLEVNSDSDLVRSSVRTSIELVLDQLRLKFLHLDPHRTGAITRPEFRKTLQELEPDINEYELYVLSQKYKADMDGRVDYLKFLAPFNYRRLPADHKSQQDKMDFVFNHSTPRHEDKNTIVEVEAYHHTKRFIKEQKGKLVPKCNQLKRAFASLDSDASGHLNILELRTALRLVTDVEVSKEDWFEILNELDTEMSGSVNYRKFLSLIEEHRQHNKKPAASKKLAKHTSNRFG